MTGFPLTAEDLEIAGETVQLLGGLRWYAEPGRDVALQQIWKVTSYDRFGHVIGTRQEWRDVEVVLAPGALN